MSIRVATWPSGTRVVWKELTWGEYKRINSSQSPIVVKAYEVYGLCIVEGPQPEEVTAGIMMYIYQYEIDSSPFAGTFRSISGPLQYYREKVSSTYLLSAQALIASVLRVPFETMETWTSDTFLTRLAQAELIAGVPLNPVDPATLPNNQTNDKKQRPKRPLTNAQQIAIERKKNDIPNFKSKGKTR